MADPQVVFILGSLDEQVRLVVEKATTLLVNKHLQNIGADKVKIRFQRVTGDGERMVLEVDG